MELTPQETEILELLNTATKRIKSLPSLYDLQSQALNNIHVVISEIANETREAVNTAVVYRYGTNTKDGE